MFACFSPDGTRVLTTCEDFTAMIWDAATGKRLIKPLKHTHQIHAGSFSADGRWVVTASRDQTARVWDARTGDPLTPPLKHPFRLARASFLADGRLVLARRLTGESQVWPLTADPRPVADLVQLAQLLSGHQSDETGGALPLTKDALLARWQTLRAKYPADFAER
jgi:WD40 repeat protein